MKKKFGIIGNPIRHSLSPVLHNYWFNKYGINADYSIIEAVDNDLKSIVNKIRDKELTGINVTLPFKQKIINQTDKIINDAETTGSVNTLLLDDEKVYRRKYRCVWTTSCIFKRDRSLCKQRCFSYRGRWCFSFCYFIFTKIWSKKGIQLQTEQKRNAFFLKKSLII